jgi:hypothetical protein
MKFFLDGKVNQNIKVLMNRIGYHQHYDRRSNKVSYIRRLGSLNYPRFHVYIDQHGDRVSFNVHLDEKKPSYGVGHRHSGQYDTELVGKEVTRIQSLLSNL